MHLHLGLLMYLHCGVLAGSQFLDSEEEGEAAGAGTSGGDDGDLRGATRPRSAGAAGVGAGAGTKSRRTLKASKGTQAWKRSGADHMTAWP